MEPTAVLDGKLMERLDELKRMLVSSIRELDKNLVVPDKIITPFRHEIIGNNVCTAGGKVLEMFKVWIALIESIDLLVTGNSFQEPQLADFGTNKQSLYDNVSDLLLGCQAVAGPLADEWAEVRGQALEERLEYVRQCARALETNSSHIVFSLQLLQEAVQTNLQQQQETRMREEVQLLAAAAAAAATATTADATAAAATAAATASPEREHAVRRETAAAFGIPRPDGIAIVFRRRRAYPGEQLPERGLLEA